MGTVAGDMNINNKLKHSPHSKKDFWHGEDWLLFLTSSDPI